MQYYQFKSDLRLINTKKCVVYIVGHYFPTYGWHNILNGSLLVN